MKWYTLSSIAFIFGALTFSSSGQGPGKGFGKGGGRNGGGPMPEEMRENIRGLFDGHDKLERKVEVTDTGYRSTTTSEDPAVVKILQAHVRQMEKRLKSGLMVRRWDPAYEEFVKHYDEIDIEITEIEKGISVVATGATEDARKVARNHAGIIGRFIKNGWSEHDRKHAAVLSGEKVAPPVTETTLGETKTVHQVGDLFLGSQPEADDWKAIKEKGIKTVLSLRHPGETDFDDKQMVEAHGMRFLNIPWNGEDELTDEVFDQVRATLQTAEHPMLLYCGSSNRSAGVWLAHRVLDQNVALETALKEAAEAGLRSEAYQAKARAYIEKRKSIPELSGAQRKEILEIGGKASSALMKNLGTQLKAALAGGDIMAAVTVCKNVAQPITAATSGELTGVTVSRTSLKTRNTEKNRPDAVDLEVLTKWNHLAGNAAEIEPSLVPIHENAVRYYHPIFVQEACLKCHGPTDAMDGKLRSFLSEAYPEDTALDYRVGDLRGAFRVEINLAESLTSPR
ncbi:MAG: DUF3365 domain-containing protein [Verrucomicrobiales bacterium]|nr:DUF3365 domain-containing protein [Verrucomicrobiales bacterium]